MSINRYTQPNQFATPPFFYRSFCHTSHNNICADFFFVLRFFPILSHGNGISLKSVRTYEIDGYVVRI